MQFVLSGATQYTQFMDIRGGAAQALKNGGSESIVSVLTRFYDPTQTSKYKRRFSANGTVLPMKLVDCIDMVEKALKAHVTPKVVSRAWDAVGTDLLPDLGSLMSLTSDLKRAFLHTPEKHDEEAVAKAWLDREKEKQEARDARKVPWTCPICGEIIQNSTWKVTNGNDKGLTLKAKHIKWCMNIERKDTNDSDSEVSSTEERVLRGDEEAENAKLSVVKVCPYSGCGKTYKGYTLVYFKKHVLTCTYRNQKELGNWVIRTSRKYDFDLLKD